MDNVTPSGAVITALPPQRPAEGDPALRDVVERTNKVDQAEGFEMCLCIGGSIISGELISARQYYYSLGDQMAKLAADPSQQDQVLQHYRSIGDGLASTEGEDIEPPNYFHMKEARVRNGQGPIPSNGGVLIRGRIRDVSAYWFGNLAVRESN